MAVIGETPNVAARVEALAKPNTVVISARTHRLVRTLFDFEDLGAHELRSSGAGASLPGNSTRTAESRFEAMRPTGLTPFVGRDEEIGSSKAAGTRRAAAKAKAVLLWEAGIGKSRIPAPSAT